MRTAEATITFPCGANWEEMRTVDDRARLCAQCDTVVTDLSAMSEDEARRTMASGSGGRLCIRYLYDPRTSEIAFVGNSTVVPATSLLRRAKQAAAVLAPVLLQACGGASGDYGPGRANAVGYEDAEAHVNPIPSAAPPARQHATPEVEDGGTDAAAAADADATNDADPDGEPH